MSLHRDLSLSEPADLDGHRAGNDRSRHHLRGAGQTPCGQALRNTFCAAGQSDLTDVTTHITVVHSNIGEGLCDTTVSLTASYLQY